MISLWRFCVVARYALAFAVLPFFAFSEATDWFHEDVHTFTNNVGQKWSYKPGTATAEGESIVLTEGELVYTPNPVASGKYIIAEHEVTFGSAAMSYDEFSSDAVGIQLVEADDGNLFAVLQPDEDHFIWVPTAAAGELDTTYIIRIEQDYTVGSEMVRYFYKEKGETQFKPIATVRLSAGARVPSKVVHAGKGTLVEMAARQAPEDPDPYNRWASCGGLLTWAGYGGSTTTADAKSLKAVYKEWVKVGETWQDGAALTGETAFVEHPAPALRFVTGDTTVPRIIGGSFTPFDISGLMVESGATGYKIQQGGTGPWATRLGDFTTGGSSWFVINENFYVTRPSGPATFYGDVHLDIASGKIFDVNSTSTTNPTKLDPATHTRLHFHGAGKLKIKQLDATGSVVLDYGDVASGKDCLQGNLKIDASTSFVLPSTVAQGDSFQLCTGSVTGGGSGAVVRSITVGDRTYSALVTIVNNTLKYEPQGYSRFADNPAVFTWAEPAEWFERGLFRRFDCATGTDAYERYAGDGWYSNVPGWENVPVGCFWWVFADDFAKADMLPYAKGAGYVLRFAGGQRAGRQIQSTDPLLAFGGLIVENGAYDYGFTGDDDADGIIRLGVDSGAVTNRLEIGEDFTIRERTLEIAGKVDMSIAAGKALTVQGSGTGEVPMANAEQRPEIRFSGDGVFVCNQLMANGSCTLDFSALSTARTEPYLKGSLDISPDVRFVFPNALAENAAYRLCTGDLSATSGVYPVAKGAGEFFLANLTFTPAGQQVSYSRVASFNQKELSSETLNWSTVSAGFTAGRPVQLTLTRDVTLLMDQAVTIPQLLVLGGHRLSVVMRKEATFGHIFCGRGTRVELVYDQQCAKFGQEMTVASGVAYDTVIQGSASVAAPAIWNGPLSVVGRLTVRGHLMLAAEDGGSEQVMVESGAVITVDGGSLQYAPADPLREVVFNLAGEWSIGAAQWVPGPGVKINFLAGGRLTGYGGEGGGLITVGDLFEVNVASGVQAIWGAHLRTAMPVACRIGQDSELTFEAEVEAAGPGTGMATYGAGSVRLRDVPVAFSEEVFATGGLYGSGEAVFHGDPRATGVCDSLTSPDRWNGVCSFVGADLADFNPDEFGHAASAVRLLGCSAYFARDVLATKTQLELAAVTDDYPYSLDVDNGYDGSLTVLGRVYGRGLLRVRANGTERYRLFLPSLQNFSGSLDVIGLNNRNAIVVGPTDVETRQQLLADTSYDGQLVVNSGDVTLADDAVWSAVSGICIRPGATLVDQGRLASPVTGEGTLKYADSLRSWQPEAAAELSTGDGWRGNVLFDSLILFGSNLRQCGNANSRITLKSCEGWLPAQTVDSEVVLMNGGFNVILSKDDAEIVFRKLTGTGSLTFAADIEATGWSYRLRDVADFTGSIKMASPHGAVLLGNAERTLDCAIEVADGLVLKGGNDWTANLVRFGPTLTIDGEVGDLVMRSLGGDGEYGYVNLTLLNGDPRRRYALDYDADNRAIYVIAAVTPPTATVDDVFVKYGVDMTNAFVSVDIRDYWAGHDFKGRTLAEVFVYDADGRIVGYRSAEILGNGTNDIGVVDLPLGRGRDYRYEVRISTDGSSSSGEFIDSRAVEETGVHDATGWFSEDVATFKATSRAGKTGNWRYSGTAAKAVDDMIGINTGSSTERVRFEPYRDSTNDVVHVTTRVVFAGAYDEDMVPVADNSTNRVAALSLVQLLNTDERLAYSGWVTDDALENGGSFVTLFGDAEPRIGVETELAWTVNYRTGYVVYSADGVVLTNAEGVSHFALSGTRRLRGNQMAFRGVGTLATTEGVERNANLARVVIGNVTNDYASVDEAVAAASEQGASRIDLLWDASWRPSADDLGKTYVFDSGEAGHRIVIDGKALEGLERGGYRVVDNGDGSYTIDVIKFAIQFWANGGEGVMMPQEYTVTNMVFNLASNQFVNVSQDFACWNAEMDGSGPTNWTDGAEIDMTPYGLTNMSLYAQWQLAVRTITIEAADEYVYIENVLTNGVKHTGVRYFRNDVTKATGRAEFQLEHGSELTVHYSTDLGKALTFASVFRPMDWKGRSIAYDEEPKLVESVLTPIQLWALSHGITLEELAASPYAESSYALGMDKLIKETSVVTVSDFAVSGNGCSFKVKIDGVPVSTTEAIIPMIRYTTNLATGWLTPTASEVSVTADGVVTINTSTPSCFVKIVIPSNPI